MTDPPQSPRKIPVFMLDSSSVDAYRIFNPNEWKGFSKAVVSSCAAQIGLIFYSASKLNALFSDPERICSTKINELNKQWDAAPWEIDDLVYFAEVPEVHLFIQAYLNSVKSFFDLLVQLLSTEQIVNKKLHGFHKQGNDPGGKTLFALKKRALNQVVAENIYKLFLSEKKQWIDTVINARDSLIHPDKGIVQLMFQLKFISGKSGLELKEISMPTIDDVNFDHYSVETYKQLVSFSDTFMKILKSS